MDNPLPDPAHTLHGKTLLIVDAGSIKKKFALLRLKKLGAKLIVLNKEKNWITSVADYIVLADLENHKEAIDAVAKFLKENREVKLDGALTFWEDGVLLLSKIIDKFDLIGIPYKVAKKVRNKAMFRDFCEKNGINAPKHQIVKTLEEARKVGKTFRYPLVVKPAFGSSSAFVLKVENFEELLHAFNYVKNNISSSVESALTEGKDILIEEYIEGDEVDIDILVQNGKIKFYSISDNSRTAEPFFLESLRTTPSTLPEKQQDALIEMAEESLEKFGIQNGCIHFEAKVGKRGAFPIEINLRMGGDEIYPSIKGVWGVDLVEDSAKIAIGIFIKKYNDDSPAKRCFLAQSFVADYSGILIKLDTDERLQNKKYFEELHWFKKVGDPVLVPPEGYDFLGWMAVSGDSILSAQDNLREALKFIHYEIAKFDPASSMGKTKRKSHFTFASANKNILLGAAKIEHLRRTSIKNQRNLHIGVACNIYDDHNAGDTVEAELMSVGRNVEKTLTERGYKVTFFDFNNLFKAIEDLRLSNVDLVFNLCERINNSSLLEPHGAAILDALQIPYTGSNPFTLSLCLDKIRVKKLLAYHNIPTPQWDYAYSLDDEISDDLKYPLIVKPANTDNSIGITNDSVVTNKAGLKKQLEKIIEEIKRPALVEEYVEGDEYDVSILGSEYEDLRVLPLSRSVFKSMPQGYWHIYPYDAKWATDPIYQKCIQVQMPPKNISTKLETVVSEIALDTYNILDCHDYGRVEIRVDKNNNPYVLELNPNPSINLGNCLPNVAALTGMDYGDFLEEIIRMAITRYKNKPPYYHLQTSLM